VLRYLPEGAYRVTAFEDVDRDGVLDERETQGTEEVVVTTGDTLMVDVATLPSDTTPAALLSASALDSVTVALEFDDYLDFETSASDIDVRIDGPAGPGPAVTLVYHEREYSEMVETVVDSLLRLDSLDAVARAAAAPADTVTSADSALAAPDSSAADSAAQRGPPGGQVGGRVRVAPRPRVPSRPAPPALTASRGAASGRGRERPIPARRLVAVLGSALDVDVEYDVTVSGVVNINGVGRGGGEATVVRRPPELPPDGAGAQPSDSVGAQPPGAGGPNQ
jgi:hypothetical protein